MAKIKVEFRVTAGDGIRYWLAVDESDLKFINGVGGIDLEESEEHVLVWWMIGNAGESISIEGKQGKRIVVTVKESRIPDGSSKGAGYRRFRL